MEKDFKDRIITKEIFDKVSSQDSYYRNRWEYFNEIIEHLHTLDDVNTVLEFGPYKLPFVEGSDIIDQYDKNLKYYPIDINNFIVHNCKKLPLPIEDKAYDLVIACQVLEHFGIFGEQVEIFNELERISKRAIISLPYLWFKPDERDHHMIDEEMISFWSSNRKPVYKMISGFQTTQRILLIYDFENESSISKAEKQKEYDGYVHQYRKQKQEIKLLNKKINQLNEKNEKLQARNDELKEQMKVIKSTKSWKITKPLRSINSKFK